LATRTERGQFLLDRIQRKLGTLHQYQPRWLERTIWRQSSEPIEPPAPETSTTFPVMQRPEQGGVRRDGFTAEQVLDFNFPYGVDRQNSRSPHPPCPVPA
jgi:hypothetical protein